jgi:chemotaxis protein methyltransferase CheR
VVGTDISSTILQQAKLGRYDKSAVMRGLSPERQQRFFKQTDDYWQVQDEIKNRISFREMNLMQSYTLLGKFDIIFCRNVLIYFSTELKRDIIHRMSQALNPNGYLILGGSESISGYSEDFELVRWKSGVIYTLKQALQRRA